MATGNYTIATQTEEEEADYSHVSAKNINFKCSEGIKARLDKFEVVNSKGFVLRLEIGGKLYNGFLIEAIDSFAPTRLLPSKKRRPTLYKRSKTRHTGVTRPKKPNVYSRENYPRGYVDTYNTIEARLRYGRDKRIQSFNSLHVVEKSSSQPKNDGDLVSDQKKKSSFAASLEANDDSNFVKKSKTRGKYLKPTLKSSNESDEASETTSNENSSSTSSLFILKDSGEISEFSSDTSFCSALIKMQYSPSNGKQTDKAVRGRPCDLKTRPGRMVSSPKMNTHAQSMNNYDTPQRATSSKVSLSRILEPDLIEFSPVVNTAKSYESVQSVATLSKPPEPDLISFSPEINNRTISRQMFFKGHR